MNTDRQISNVPGIVFGCMTFGNQVDEKSALEILNIYKEHQKQEGGRLFDIDTAYVYADGKSEVMLGSLFTSNSHLNENLFLSTKAHPKINGLTPQSVRKQLEESLARLQRTKVDVLYLHNPDHNTPIRETLQACHQLHIEGKFNQLGLSNFPSWQVVDIWHICNQNGWVKPTFYQAMYNLITRKVEKELFPALRTLGIRIYAYNPLAGGLLTGKYSNELVEGRFTLPVMGEMYKQRYWKPSYINAIDLLSKSISQYNQTAPEQPLSLLQVAFSWLVHHSALKQNDTIIIGTSEVNQLIENLKAIHTPPLPPAILSACDQAHSLCAADCPDYYR